MLVDHEQSVFELHDHIRIVRLPEDQIRRRVIRHIPGRHIRHTFCGYGGSIRLFDNVSSKNGNGFVNEIKRRIENLKNEVDNLRKSIEDIDEKAKADAQGENKEADNVETTENKD